MEHVWNVGCLLSEKKMNGRRNEVYQEDCLKGMRERLNQKEVDVVVTSPPYNIGKNYNTYDDEKKRGDYLSWLHDVGREIKRVLSDGGSFFLNIGNKPSYQWNALELALEMRDLFELQNTIHWIKSIALPEEETGEYVKRDIAVGHYKPVNSERFLHSCHEYIFHFTKDKNVNLDRLAVGISYQDKSNVGRYSDKDLRGRGNTWFISYKTILSKRPHPSPFPVKLPEMCIKLHGVDKTELVLDPFMGIGSTGIACKKLGVSFIGFEIDEKYVKIAEKRLNQKRLPKISS